MTCDMMKYDQKKYNMKYDRKRPYGVKLTTSTNTKAVGNLYLTRVIPSEYLKVYLLSIGALD